MSTYLRTGTEWSSHDPKELSGGIGRCDSYGHAVIAQPRLSTQMVARPYQFSPRFSWNNRNERFPRWTATVALAVSDTASTWLMSAPDAWKNQRWHRCALCDLTGESGPVPAAATPWMSQWKFLSHDNEMSNRGTGKWRSACAPLVRDTFPPGGEELEDVGRRDGRGAGRHVAEEQFPGLPRRGSPDLPKELLQLPTNGTDGCDAKVLW